MLKKPLEQDMCYIQSKFTAVRANVSLAFAERHKVDYIKITTFQNVYARLMLRAAKEKVNALLETPLEVLVEFLNSDDASMPMKVRDELTRGMGIAEVILPVSSLKAMLPEDICKDIHKQVH